MSFTPSESPGTTSQIQVAIDDQGNNGTGGARSSTETLDILIDHNPPVIIQGDSINASVEEDKESTWTIPEITATDPNMKFLQVSVLKLPRVPHLSVVLAIPPPSPTVLTQTTMVKILSASRLPMHQIT